MAINMKLGAGEFPGDVEKYIYANVSLRNHCTQVEDFIYSISSSSTWYSMTSDYFSEQCKELVDSLSNLNDKLNNIEEYLQTVLENNIIFDNQSYM